MSFLFLYISLSQPNTIYMLKVWVLTVENLGVKKYTFTEAIREFATS